jgi:hypothetical protein
MAKKSHKKTKGMNRHQKATHREGEERVGRQEIEQLLELSHSPDAEDRKFAASYLCPCHVRRRIEDVWEALYRMLEDENVEVRRNAWHTLEDGGRPDDPKLDEIFARAEVNETDRNVLAFLRQLGGSRQERDALKENLSHRNEYDKRGKCDFCGQTNVAVKTDYDTEINASGTARLGLICKECVGVHA